MMSEMDDGDLPPPDITAHETRKNGGYGSNGHEEPDSTEPQLSSKDVENDEGNPDNRDANASTAALHNQSGVVEDLEDSEDSPEISRNSKLTFTEDRPEEDGSSRGVEGPQGPAHSRHQVEAGGMGTPSTIQQQTNGQQFASGRSLQTGLARMSIAENQQPLTPIKPIDIKPVHIGDMKIRSKLKFEVVTAKVVEENGKKHVTYTIMMKRASGDPHPAVIHRRYNDFCNLYERILCSFHPSILGDFQFPKKVLIGNFKAEVISDRTEAFHKFLNLVAACDKLLYSDYFHAFLCSEEQNEAVSYIKLGQYGEAAPLLENLFYVKEKLFTLSHITVMECVIELVACLAAIEADDNAYRYALIGSHCIQFQQSLNEINRVRIPFLKLTEILAAKVGHDPKPYKKQLSELRYSGIKTENVPPLLEVVRDRYIHTATRTSRLW